MLHEECDDNILRTSSPKPQTLNAQMQAPSGVELHEECVRKIHDLHKFDCLRANKATMAWGVEARVPFLDKDFLETVTILGFRV